MSKFIEQHPWSKTVAAVGCAAFILVGLSVILPFPTTPERNELLLGYLDKVILFTGSGLGALVLKRATTKPEVIRAETDAVLAGALTQGGV